MKCYLLFGLTLIVATLAFSPVANAGQTHLNDLEADLNGDGIVTLTELKIYNRAQRHA